ncbi:MAG: nitrate/nitrite transporter [Methylophagaceae bacterium]
MATQKTKAWSVTAMSTLSFTTCFMVWMMFAVIGIPIKETLGLNETQFGLLIAMPVLTGSLFRLPMGILTDIYGGRIVFMGLMLSTIIPMWLISAGTEYWHYLVLGLFVGLAGASFTVGISYVARWFPKNQQGTAMGIFGAGNVGAALTKLIAPSIVVAYGWTMVPKVYAVLMTVMAVAFWLFTYDDPSHKLDKKFSLSEELKALKDPVVWKLCQYYSIVFGGYVALALWMTKYYIAEYGFDLKTAALLAACFSLPGGLLRAMGGYFSDKYGAQTVTWLVFWVSMICLFFLSYPQAQISIMTVENTLIDINLGLSATTFTILMFTIGVAFAIGKASVFKYISDDYTHNIGVISGIVGLAGGLGGFILPIMFGALVDFTGVRSSVFMLMFGIIWVSLVWMYWTEIRPMKAKMHQADIDKRAAIAAK